MKLTIEQTLLQLRALGFPAPVAEYRFCERGWRFDWAWVRTSVLDGKPYGVAFEIEGGTRKPGGGRHNRAKGYEDDCEKYSRAAIAGWVVVRTTTAMVESGAALNLLEAALRAAAIGE